MAKQHRVGMTWVELCIVVSIISLLIGLLLPFVQHAREEARKSSWKNNLKSIGLALHNYHETHGCFPSGGIIREDGVAMHGWMMMIMPFLDANPLSAMIDYDQSWDHRVNTPVFERSIPYFMIVGEDFGLTSAGHGLTQILGNPNLMHRNSSATLRELKGGTEHNWLAGEIAGNLQPWGYPFNWRPLGSKLCNGPNSFGHPAWNGGHLLRANGGVSFFSDQTSPEILKSFATAPPIATETQTAVPERIFETGNVYWDRIDLLSKSQAKNKYIAKVLVNATGKLSVIHVYSKANPLKEGPVKSKGSEFIRYFMFHIDSTTEVSKALEATSLFTEATAEQSQANVKTLKRLQRQLQ